MFTHNFIAHMTQRKSLEMSGFRFLGKFGRLGQTTHDVPARVKDIDSAAENGDLLELLCS